MNLAQFTKNGKFFMLALDHRASFKKLMNPNDPESVSTAAAAHLKAQIINSVEPLMSGVLIDQEFGLPAYRKGSKPFLLPVEKSGYTDKLGERITEIEYTIKQLQEWGAGGAKILLYFNPKVATAKVQLHTAKRILEECKQADFPLFLEIRVYKPDTGDELGENLTELVLGSMEMFLERNIHPQVWKLEYPGSLAACQQISQMVGQTPWILLTKGSSFEDFVEVLKEAQQAGCSGFLAGRAIWQEVGQLVGEDRQKFLSSTLPHRFQTICEVFN